MRADKTDSSIVLENFPEQISRNKTISIENALEINDKVVSSLLEGSFPKIR